MLMRAAVRRPGDRVRYDGGDYQVIALAGTSVRLRSEHGAESVLPVAHLMGSSECAVIDGAPTPSGEPFGLMDGLPVKASRTAPHNAIQTATRTPTGQTVMKGVAIWRCLDHSAISGAQAGDLAPVLITLERLAATKVTRMRVITNRTAATGPSP
jgi:hypothetical protein